MNVVNDNKIKATAEASMSSLVLGNLSWKIENDNQLPRTKCGARFALNGETNICERDQDRD